MTDHARDARLARSMMRLASRMEAFSGTCFRCVRPRYSSSLAAFSGEGSRNASGRFHVKGRVLIVYTGTELQTAEWEYLNTARSTGIDTAYLLPYTAVSAEVRLSRVLNLCDFRVHRTLNVSLADLRASLWSEAMEETLTQRLGRLAYEQDFEAILTRSAGKGQNLNIFPRKLLSTSSIQVINAQELPGA